jgi:outer membrane murein-binding lipoprotein Lpp
MNGHGDFDPAELHREGCSFGQKQAIHMEYILKEIQALNEKLDQNTQEINAKFDQNSADIKELSNKVDTVKTDLIKEVTKNEAQRNVITAFISALISIGIAFGKYAFKGGA